MVAIVLYQPEIPPNTGNVIRLAANTGASLHLVRPLGFSLRHKQLQRAGLDYHDLAKVMVHADWASCLACLQGPRMFAVSTRSARLYDSVAYRASDVFVFGSETQGLPSEVLAHFESQHRIRIPMRDASRSLNLANAVAVVVFEAWRQLGFTKL